jgi:acetyl-CoA carboxylase biotin carboxyl carrier protein
MNEIQSDVDGEIVEVLVKNEEMVEYNQPMFKIRVK